jgi:hypothetical protein
MHFFHIGSSERHSDAESVVGARRRGSVALSTRHGAGRRPTRGGACSLAGCHAVHDEAIGGFRTIADGDKAASQLSKIELLQ